MLGEKGIEFVSGDPLAADYQVWLNSQWTAVKHPFNGAAGVQLQADLQWVNRAGTGTPILSSDGRVTSFVQGGQAVGDCVDKFMDKESGEILEGVQDKLADFHSNGREIFVYFDGANFEALEPLSAALKLDPLIKDCRRELVAGSPPRLTCRTFLRTDDLEGLIRLAAGSLGPNSLDVSATLAQATELRFVVK